MVRLGRIRRRAKSDPFSGINPALIILMMPFAMVYSCFFDGTSKKVQPLPKASDNDKAIIRFAAENCNLESVKFLEGNIINISDKQELSTTALHHAAKGGCLEVIKFLVGKEVGINSTYGKFKSTALHYAASNGHLEVVKFLLENGANPNVKNDDGKTPKKVATELKHNKDKPYIEIINLLYDSERLYKSKW